ncbi:TonB-dependent receptor [Zobellia alginiliquefaciens]|uniref:TonB-dependent receptor n=1 Tax=Zobellia alginiliquefaciens TaxID=3032586 RepID=UPI0023E39B41|nr:TonB-dependent receptor [Zobellia alginiliquefaciens]
MKKFLDQTRRGLPLLKLNLKMKISMLFMFMVLFTMQAKTSYSQVTKISLDLNNVSVERIIDEIESQTEFHFVYQIKDVDLKRVISVKAKKETVPQILNRIFAETRTTHRVVDKQIFLKERRRAKLIHDKKIVKQEFVITGTVTDTDGQPLPGANIVEKGTANGVTADFDGNFSLEVAQDAIIVVSYIGFASKEIPVNGQTTVNVSLEESAAGLEEVVVVGYGSLKKGDITGSVGSLKMDETLKSRAVVDFGQAMSGKVAGVQVLNGSGRPGTSSSIQIRGVNSISAGSSPLIVIDGVQLPEYNLNSINSSDIESIEVLKDASSASIYGSRGANGVILVTTKSGKVGEPVLQLNYTTSIQQVIRKIDVMDASEYAQTAIDAAQNGWIDSGGDPDAPNTLEARGNYKYTWPIELESPENLANTDFQNLIFRAAPMHKIDLSYSGGDEKSNYSISGGYINQEGIVITSDYKKYSLNMNVESRIKDWLKMGAMLNTVYDHENEPYRRIVEWAVQYPAIYPIYGNDGYLGGPLTVDGFENYSAILFRPNNGHPLYRINDDIQHRRFTAMGNFFTEFKFNDYLRFKTSFNAFYKNEGNTDYNAGDHNLGDSFKTTASFTVDNNRTLSYTWGNLLTFDKKINNHSVNMIVGFEYNHRDYYMDLARRQGYDNDNIHSLSAGQEIIQATDAATQTNLVSVLGRINYNYLSKYIVAASYRRDGSSRFGPNTKWGNFYSFSGAWRVSDENFMQAFKNISSLKLKASYGVTGNDNFADYRWISKLTQARTAIGNSLITTYYPSNIENPDLEWEGTKQSNFGLDLGLFQSRLSIGADFYHSKSDNLLLDIPIPSTSGYTSAFTNNGEVENKGLEVDIQTINISNEKLTWSTQLNYSMNRSKVTKLGRNSAPMIFNSNMPRINQIGEAAFGFYGYKYDGVYKNQAEIDADSSSPASTTPGDGRYVDVNGDGVLNANDRTIIGNIQPDFIWGATNSFVSGNFDLSFSLQGVVGGEIYDNNANRSLLYHEGRNYLDGVNGRWRSVSEPGDGYHYKVSVDVDGLEKTASSYWLSNGTYLRLKDVTVGFKLPENIISKFGLLNARLFINGVNLLTISEAPVYDPENFAGQNGDGPLYRGNGGNAYPSAKIYSLGLNVKF